MKTILKSGNTNVPKKPITFRCHTCDCEFESDEYERVISGWYEQDIACGTIRRQVLGYNDICPECDKPTHMTATEKEYVYSQV